MSECPLKKPSLVPFVARWEGERLAPESDLMVQMGPAGIRLGYKVESPEDRTGNVLWARVEQKPGTGRPEYAEMHPGRQYLAMFTMKCQVCGLPASRNKDGWLFLDWRKSYDPPTWPERSLTAMPPLCDTHVHTAVEECPHLRGTDFVTLRVRSPRLWGYSGTAYTLTANGWMTHQHEALLRLSDPNLRGILATRLIRELRNVTVVDTS
ncbi:hypothetical protein ACIRPT_27280 [Streptomyces sp. NPDC101227]|uniref:hypothetical protein n=1 Tax=Streptomyces sp. NPDC101227 TaxID=3366136 RepID=UPI003805BBD5